MASRKPRTRSRYAKRGQPTKCTPETAERVRKAVLKGAGREDAARAAGVAPSTAREWLARGASGEEPYAAFLAAVEGAESELVRRAGAVVVDLLGGKKTPHAVRFAAAKLVLERRRAEVWAPKKDVRVSGPDGGPVPFAGQLEHSGQVGVTAQVQPGDAIPWDVMRDMTPEQLEAFARGLRADDDNEERG
jgi:hypothetical protein